MCSKRWEPTDTNRAVSTTLAYVLALAITVMLVGGLMLAAGGFVAGEQRQVIRSELEVIGQQLAADATAADRLNRTAGVGDEVRVTSRLPQRVASRSYTVRITPDGGPDRYALVLETDRPAVTVTVGFTSGSAVETGTLVGGGDVAIEYVAGANRLEVRRV